MEADLLEVYFFVLIFIYPNFLAIHKDAVKQNNRFSAFDSLGQNQFRTSSLLAIIDRWLLAMVLETALISRLISYRPPKRMVLETALISLSQNLYIIP